MVSQYAARWRQKAFYEKSQKIRESLGNSKNPLDKVFYFYHLTIFRSQNLCLSYPSKSSDFKYAPSLAEKRQFFYFYDRLPTPHY